MTPPSVVPDEHSEMSVPGNIPHEEFVAAPKQVTMPDFGLVVFESRHREGFYGQLQDEYSKFHLVIGGHARWEGKGVSCVVGPDTLFHISAGVPHRQRDLPHDPVSVYVIHYRPSLLDKDLSDRLAGLGMLPLDLASPKINQTAAIRATFREMLFEQEFKQLGWQVLLQTHLIELTVRTLRIAERKSANEPKIFEAGTDSSTRVAHYALRLKTRFYRNETLEDAAKSVCLGRRQFTDLFRRITGQTWRKYVNTLRLEYAAKLFANSEKSVIAVAFESGFEDLSHFNHCFKAVFGCSPRVYRKRHRPN